MTTNYGERLLVTVVDERAASDYPTPFAYLPRGSHPDDGFIQLSYADLKRAVDRCAWHLDEYIGKSTTFDTFAWLAHPLDLRYQILTLAAMKTGWRAFFPSPRNSLQGQLSLLNEADCQIWLVDNKPDPVVTQIRERRELKLVKIPTLEELLSDIDPVPHYPYTKTFESARSDPVCVLHTSGSTGIPKVIICKHTLFTVMDAFHDLLQSGQRPFIWQYFVGMKAFMPFPNFHAAGLITSLGANIWFDTVNVIAPQRPLTAELVDAYHQSSAVDLSILPPSILKEIAADEVYLKHLSGLKYIGNCGGPSTQEVGTALSKYTYPLSIIGITETSTLPTELIGAEDYLYMRYSPCSGMHFRPVSNKYYEMTLERDNALRNYQHIFNTFPHLDEWSSKDLYERHPSKPDLWKYVGRSDDVIVFSNGEKLNPITIAQRISSHPWVTGVAMFGTGHFEAGLLVEGHTNDGGDISHSSLLDEIWSLSQEVNAHTVAHGRVSKDMIVFASPEKPFPRSGKGSVQRRMLFDLYSDEIDKAYSHKRLPSDDELQGLSSRDAEVLRKSLRHWIEEHTGQQIPHTEDDLFNAGLGFDSLLVLRLTHDINRAANKSVASSRMIYASPTISGIAHSILSAREGNDVEPVSYSREDAMTSMLERYAEDLRTPSSHPARPSTADTVVAVTGTTGTFGSYLLDSLIRNRQVQKIYCLNRRADAESAQVKLHHSQSLAQDFSKLSFLTINLSRPQIALSPSDHRLLLEDVTIVIHNAWLVDFNLPLSSFGPSHLHGVRELLNLCASSHHHAALFFLSSISTVENWRPPPTSESNFIEAQLVPETEHPWSTSARIGYSESKHVAEHLIARASRDCGISAAICRIGQIAGPVRHGVDGGCWPKREWIPSLIQSSIELKCFPRDLGALERVDWVPADVLGDVVSEMAMGVFGDGLQVLHAVNPKATEWGRLLETVMDEVVKRTCVEVVPFGEWVEKLRQRVDAEGLVGTVEGKGKEGCHDTLPAARLLSFFETEAAAVEEDSRKRKARCDTQLAQAQSETLRSLDAINPDWMALWMRQWRFADCSDDNS